jgi:hypothetical protein
MMVWSLSQIKKIPGCAGFLSPTLIITQSPNHQVSISFYYLGAKPLETAAIAFMPMNCETAASELVTLNQQNEYVLEIRSAERLAIVADKAAVAGVEDVLTEIGLATKIVELNIVQLEDLTAARDGCIDPCLS